MLSALRKKIHVPLLICLYCLQAFVKPVNSEISSATFMKGDHNTIDAPVQYSIDVAPCGKSKGCVRSPSFCDGADCDHILTWQKDEAKSIVKFELGAKTSDSSPWIAVGFSDDINMPKTSVIDCIVESSSDIHIQASYNPGYYNEVLKDQSGILQEESSASFTDGVLVCRFTAKLEVAGNDKIANLSQSHYLFLAHGKASNGLKQKHEEDPLVTPQKVSVSENSDINLGGSDQVTGFAPVQYSIDVAPCGKSKGCVRSPSFCVGNECDHILTWQMDEAEELVKFELGANTSDSSPWIAVGFSYDTKMPNTSVIDCIVESSSNIIIQASYNPGYYNEVLKNQSGIIQEESSASFTDGVLVCKFTAKLEVPGNYQIANLSQSHFLFLANGKASNGVKHKHDKDPLETPQKVSMSENIDINLGAFGKDNSFLITHAVLMIVSWMFLSSIGIISARHFKFVWNSKICGQRTWFQVHRMLMFLTIVLVVLALVLVFLAENTEPLKQKEIHPILGMIVASLMVINAMLGLCRPEQGTAFRPVFNWLHSLVGNTAHLTAVVTMFYGIRALSGRAAVPSWCQWVIVAFGVWRVAIELLMTAQKYYNREDLREGYVEISGFVEGVQMGRKTYCFKTTVVVVYLVGAMGMTIAVLAGFLPVFINPNWQY